MEIVIRHSFIFQEHNADFWLSLNKNLDNTWKYDDGTPDIREIWQSSQPDGNGNCSCFKYSYSYQLVVILNIMCVSHTCHMDYKIFYIINTTLCGVFV